MKKMVVLIFALITGIIPVYADQLECCVYNIECVAGGRVLDVYYGYDYNGANVCVWVKDGTPQQNFKLTDRGGNHYVIMPQTSSSRVLDVCRGNSISLPLRAGNNIDIYDQNDAPAQEWYIDHRGDGKYTIELVHARGLVVACDNPWINNGNVTLQRYTGNANQLWYLKKVGGSSSNGGGFQRPVNGPVTWPFGANHNGTDFGIPIGTSVKAAKSGTVTIALAPCPHNYGKSGNCGCNGGYGNYVKINHGDGTETLYAHLTSLSVSKGQHVSQGQEIGRSGSTGWSTGPHLHFEIRVNGVNRNPENYLR